MRLLERSHRANFYYRVLVIILISALLPILVLNLLSVNFITTDMQRELKKLHQNSLNTTSNSMDMIFRQIIEGCRLISQDATFISFGKYPAETVEYLESMEGRYSDEDVYALSQYMKLKGEVFESLRNQMYNKPFIDSVYFYDVNKEYVYTNNHSSYRAASFSDQDFFRIGKDVVFTPYVTSLREIKTSEGSPVWVITLLFGSVKMGDRGIFAVNIDADKLGEYLFSNTDDVFAFMFSSDDMTMITKTSGMPDAFYSKLQEPAVQAKLSQMQGSGSFTDGNYIISKYQSPYYWTYVSLVNTDVIFRSSRVLSERTLLLSAVLLLVSVVLAVLSSNQIYRPILSLQKAISAQISHHKGKDIFFSIEEALKNTKLDNESLRTRIVTLTPYYDEKVLASLIFHNGVSDNDAQISAMRWGFEPVGYALLAVSVGDTAQNTTMQPTDLFVPRYFEQMAEIHLSRKGVAMRDMGGRYFLLLNLSSEDYRDIYSFSGLIISEFREELSCDCFIGISSHYSDYQRLSEARWEAQEAVCFALMSGNEKIYFYTDLFSKDRAVRPFQAEHSGFLIDCIKTGNRQKAIAAWEQIIKNLRTTGGFFSRNRVTFLEICGEIYCLLLDSHQRPEELCPPLSKAYRDLLDGNETIFLKNIDTILETLCSFFASNIEKQGSDKIRTILMLIENHYSEDISITAIAEMVHMNPDYLGRIFKEHTGYTFIEYLTRARIQQSIRLLKTTRMRIKDIGTAVGYPNCNYFIKVFKNIAGVTPKEFQNSNICAERNER